MLRRSYIPRENARYPAHDCLPQRKETKEMEMPVGLKIGHLAEFQKREFGQVILKLKCRGNVGDTECMFLITSQSTILTSLDKDAYRIQHSLF